MVSASIQDLNWLEMGRQKFAQLYSFELLGQRTRNLLFPCIRGWGQDPSARGPGGSSSGLR